MMLKKTATLVLGLTLLLTACGKESVEGQNDDGITNVKVAFEIGSKPMTYLDENGQPAGYDIDVMKRVDEKLEAYSFEFVGTTSDDLLIGVEQGKFQAGVKNAFYTEERAKKYIYPKQFIGLSSAGLALKAEYEHIQSLADFATEGFTLAPIAANNAQYTVIAEHNHKNPDNPVKLEAGEEFGVDVVQWVNEGRVDGGVMIQGVFDKQVSDPNGPYHHLQGDVVYKEFAVIKTWPLFHKKQQALADAYDQALEDIAAAGELEELSQKHYGRNLFEVLDRVER
ncbi:transporter substrate-binding domain-containing protein [Bacillaceae bacterium SIJ1]|uniref:transporter substrate-binding domain-containing protein n=1 Tax=Litoribacterium kuwaitense TaxID=1398745 RepID=UPI0013ECA66B|nr:transporter substrate-binding domain-containing protein [Litoribacterium kuwaitense]NGP46457.1 transporter substrate-binding domain-containing protein [Litoribacterium kuwaitense]